MCEFPCLTWQIWTKGRKRAIIFTAKAAVLVGKNAWADVNPSTHIWTGKVVEKRQNNGDLIPSPSRSHYCRRVFWRTSAHTASSLSLACALRASLCALSPPTRFSPRRAATAVAPASLPTDPIRPRRAPISNQTTSLTPSRVAPIRSRAKIPLPAPPTACRLTSLLAQHLCWRSNPPFEGLKQILEKICPVRMKIYNL